MGLIMRKPKRFPFISDRRGVAAAEFALIAPALIFIVMGVLEMSLRFRAGDEATRYVHQVADLIARENALKESELVDLYEAAPHMMMPLETADQLDLDISSVGFVGDEAEPEVFWRRVAGEPVNFDPSETAGMGLKDETVIRIGIRYHYTSVITELFGGSVLSIEREAFTRPRMQRVVTLEGEPSDGGDIKPIG